MTDRQLTVVFVHGWSVTNTDTYGGLPARLAAEADRRGFDLAIKHLFLGRYISFHDEVRLRDVSRAFDAAVADTLAGGSRFVCITHSTGGPVVRDWWQRFHPTGVCPMSHLIMLAPANFGSALAQLGKSRVGRLKAWMDGIEPGQGILDWLEHGSDEGCALNESWIHGDEARIGARGVFPFVLTGQSIDRAIYDHLNSYTGEPGSDGVVRVAAANLNAVHLVLRQGTPEGTGASLLRTESFTEAPPTAMRVIAGAAHSGTTCGIMRAVKPRAGHRKGRNVVAAILECLSVESKADYRSLAARFAAESAAVQDSEAVETAVRVFGGTRHYLHDRHCMIVFRIRDDQGNAVEDFDLLLTAGPDSDPNALPTGFFQDRQLNRRCRHVLTYYLNHDVMTGAPERRAGNELIRPAVPGIDALGLVVRPRPDRGFVHYLEAEAPASPQLLAGLLRPNATALVDILLSRVVHENVFRLQRYQGGSTRGSFRTTKPGDEIVD